MKPKPLHHPIHETCQRRSGYLCNLAESETEQGGWTWHLSLRGALAQKKALHDAEGGRYVTVYRITSEDTSELVRV